MASHGRGKATTPDQPGTPSVTSQSSGSIGLSWTAPAFTGGAPLTDYKLEYSTNSGSSWTTYSHSAGWVTSVTTTGLTDFLTYIWRVSAINAVGTGIASSNSASVAQFNDASGGTVTNYTGNGTNGVNGATYRVHTFTGSANITINRAVQQFTVFAQGGGAGGGYGAGGGRGYSVEGNYTIPAGSVAVTVGSAVSGGYNEVTNRDAPGSAGIGSSLGSYVSVSGGVSRGQVIGSGASTLISGSTVNYGGSGGACIINQNANSGGYPGGGTGGSTGNPANMTGGGGGGCQWTSGGGARGEVIVRYRTS